MLQPSSAESLETSRPDYQYTAEETASSLKENRYAVLQLDEQSIVQMETAHAALKEFYEDFIAGGAFHMVAQHSSEFAYHPGHEAAAPGSPVSLLSQVCLIKVFA